MEVDRPGTKLNDPTSVHTAHRTKLLNAHLLTFMPIDEIECTFANLKFGIINLGGYINEYECSKYEFV